MYAFTFICVCVWFMCFSFMCFSYQIIFQSDLIFLILLFRSSAMRILSLCGLGFYFLVLAEVFPLYIRIMCTAWYISSTEKVSCFVFSHHRRTQIASFLSALQNGGIMNTLHVLLVYLQTSPYEQRALVAVLLLHFDLMVCFWLSFTFSWWWFANPG